MRTQKQKAEAFRALHARKQAFVIPNPWDIGTARILARLGFEALATTSAGFAFSSGVPDNQVGRERMLEHVAELADATDLPVSADLENGFGDDPESAAETIRLAAAAGVCGGSIEDSIDRPGERSVRTCACGRSRARGRRGSPLLPFPFTLTARAENYLVGIPDLKGHDPPAPGLPGSGRRRALRALHFDARGNHGDRRRGGPARELPDGHAAAAFFVAELSEMGVRRISVGSALATTALGAFLRGAREMKDAGTLHLRQDSAGFGEISDLLKT